MGNLESEMLAKMWAMKHSMRWVEGGFEGSCWLWDLSGEAGMMHSLIGVGSGLGRPGMFPSKMAGKRYATSVTRR